MCAIYDNKSVNNKTYFVDAFTNQKFKGNPAAVCITESDIGETIMQNIATEIGFSETAFVKKISDNIYSIRFYTPKQEIPLCGHATLASSKIIFVTTTLEKISFINRENVELKIRKIDGIIIMQFPVYETCEMDVPKSILDALSIDKTLNTSSLKTGMMTTELFTDKVLIYGEAVTVFEGEFKN